eukprot:6438188-Amphidinium_carterae.1
MVFHGCNSRRSAAVGVTPTPMPSNSLSVCHFKEQRQQWRTLHSRAQVGLFICTACCRSDNSISQLEERIGCWAESAHSAARGLFLEVWHTC